MTTTKPETVRITVTPMLYHYQGIFSGGQKGYLLIPATGYTLDVWAGLKADLVEGRA